jgi:hypothetical protein
MIRRLKLAYMVYNFFNRNRLKHNLKHYRKLGLNKQYFSPVSSKDFKDLDPEILKKNFDRNRPVNISETDLQGFHENGYLVLQNYLKDEQVDSINEGIQKLIDSGEVKFRHRNKIMFAFKKLPLVKEIGTNPDLLAILSALMEGNAELFQSINFITGSEQHTHSDSVHMTTFPLGGLLGVWIALEDIDEDNGPLHYYPKSHLLPYYLNADYGNEGNKLLLGPKDYTEYEKMIDSKVKELSLQKKIFTAKKGDLLIWHANLLHGGEPHHNKSKTRKSMVLHYYNTDCICYHEITQRPALMG